MIIVDSALAERVREDNPVRVGVVGAGFSGSRIVHQIVTAVPGLRVVAVANRTRAHAEAAYRLAGVERTRRVTDPTALQRSIGARDYAVTEDPDVLWNCPDVDVVIEATGTIEHGARVALESIRHGKHVVLVNAEMDATVGPILRQYADRAGVVFTDTDGDEPGVAMNMLRFVRSIGLDPVVAGNLKGLYDRYRNPTTQAEFARRNNQKPEAMTSFADGTKLSMELAVLANASGFGVARRGMYGPALDDVYAAPAYYADKLIDGGMVDFLCGAKPANGAFVLGRTDDPVRADYLRYLKMGDGPLYAFYTPFHLPHLEVPNTVARAALLGDATVTPQGLPVADAVAVAKRDLRAGETLDGIGGYCCYTLLENYAEARSENLLPMGVSAECVLKRDINKDTVLTYADIELPAGRLCDRPRVEQDTLLRQDSMVARTA
jgi:predicted homoserine dehydrogenase-like protein